MTAPRDPDDSFVVGLLLTQLISVGAFIALLLAAGALSEVPGLEDSPLVGGPVGFFGVTQGLWIFPMWRMNATRPARQHGIVAAAALTLLANVALIVSLA